MYLLLLHQFLQFRRQLGGHPRSLSLLDRTLGEDPDAGVFHVAGAHHLA